MADEPSGNDDTTDDGWNGPSATDPDVESTADSSEDDRGVADRIDRTSAGNRRERDDDDDGWDRIPLDLSGSRDADESDAGTEGEDEYTPEASSTPIEPGDPDLENVLFVLLGAIAMVLVLARLVMIPLG